MTEELADQIRQAAAVLKQYGAKEVYLFGSAATGEMDEHSDIDLAVTGLPAEVFFKAWARAVRHLPGREMDLLDLDGGGPLVEYLRQQRELLRVA